MHIATAPIRLGFIIALTSLLANCQTNETEYVKRIGYPIKKFLSGDEHGGVTVLMDKVEFEDGVLFGFVAYYRNTNPVFFQLWRPVGGNDTINNSTYKLIGSYKISMDPPLGYREYQLKDILSNGGCIRLKKGDRLGVYIPSASPIGREFYRQSGLTLNHNGYANLSQTINFDMLQFPYRYSMAAFLNTDPAIYDEPCVNCGEFQVKCPDSVIPSQPDINDTLVYIPTPKTGSTGPAGPVGGTGDQGATGPVGGEGATGQVGKNGGIGAKGDQGNVGPQGKRGMAGQPGAGQSVADDFNEKTFIIVLLIWLIVLTLITLIIIIVLIVRRRRNRDKDQKTPTIRPTDTKIIYSERPTSYPIETDVQQQQQWMSDMKEENEQPYMNNTIQRTVNADGQEVYAEVPMITTTEATLPLDDTPPPPPAPASATLRSVDSGPATTTHRNDTPTSPGADSEEVYATVF